MKRPRAGRWLLGLGLALAASYTLWSETMTLSTAYPSPSGVYKNLIATLDAVFARDGGSVGIGTAAPASKLHVNGALTITDGSQAAGRVLTSDAQGLASWQAPAGGPIVCAGGQQQSFNQPGYYGHQFTAGECGGTLPDTSYVGALRGLHTSGGLTVGGFGVLDAGENIAGGFVKGPAVWFWSNTPLQGSPVGVAVSAVWVKKSADAAPPKKYSCGSCTVNVRTCQTFTMNCGVDGQWGRKCSAAAPTTLGGTGVCSSPTSMYSAQSCATPSADYNPVCYGTCTSETVSCMATNTPL